VPRLIIWMVAALCLAGCVGQSPSVDPAGVSPDSVPVAERIALSDTSALAAQVSGGTLDLIVVHRSSDGAWLGHKVTSTRGHAGENSVNLITFGGESTGSTWNTFVYGTAQASVDHVFLADFVDAVGGKVVDGAWAIALHNKNVAPGDLHWMFVAPDGTTHTGTGIFGPEP